MTVIEELTQKILAKVREKENFIPFSGERFVGAAELYNGEMNLIFLAALTLREAERWASHELGDYYRKRLAQFLKPIGVTKAQKVLLKASLWTNIANDLVYDVHDALGGASGNALDRLDADFKKRAKLAAHMTPHGDELLAILNAPTSNVQEAISKYAASTVKYFLQPDSDWDFELHWVSFFVLPKETSNEKFWDFLAKVEEVTGDYWDGLDLDREVDQFFMI